MLKYFLVTFFIFQFTGNRFQTSEFHVEISSSTRLGKRYISFSNRGLFLYNSEILPKRKNLIDHKFIPIFDLDERKRDELLIFLSKNNWFINEIDSLKVKGGVHEIPRFIRLTPSLNSNSKIFLDYCFRKECFEEHSLIRTKIDSLTLLINEVIPENIQKSFEIKVFDLPN